MVARNTRFIGNDIYDAVEIEPSAHESYPDRVKLSYSQAAKLSPSVVMKSLDTTDRGGPGRHAKRWYRWFASATDILADPDSTRSMREKAMKALGGRVQNPSLQDLIPKGRYIKAELIRVGNKVKARIPLSQLKKTGKTALKAVRRRKRR